MGKSTFAHNVAVHAASKGHTAVLFSLEMPRKMIVLAILSSMSGVDFKRLQRSRLTPEEHALIDAAATRLDALGDRLVIVECAGIQPHQLIARMRRWRRKGAGVFLIDHAQMMIAGDRIREEVTQISRAMKHAALGLEVPVVLLSQLSRGPENRRPPRPRMSDLRESGSIEQDADQVLLFYREHYYHPSAENEHFGEIIVAKGRYVGNETVVLGWRGENARWENPTPEAVAAYQAREKVGAGGRPEDTGLKMLILQALAPAPMGTGELLDAVSRTRGADIPRSTFFRWLRKLESEGRIQQPKEGAWAILDEGFQA
jgi:replicative DNA helicase